MTGVLRPIGGARAADQCRRAGSRSGLAVGVGMDPVTIEVLFAAVAGGVGEPCAAAISMAASGGEVTRTIADAGSPAGPVLARARR
jgi:hypothetical protein